MVRLYPCANTWVRPAHDQVGGLGRSIMIYMGRENGDYMSTKETNKEMYLIIPNHYNKIFSQSNIITMIIALMTIFYKVLR